MAAYPARSQSTDLSLFRLIEPRPTLAPTPTAARTPPSNSAHSAPELAAPSSTTTPKNRSDPNARSTSVPNTHTQYRLKNKCGMLTCGKHEVTSRQGSRATSPLITKGLMSHLFQNA